MGKIDEENWIYVGFFDAVKKLLEKLANKEKQCFFLFASVSRTDGTAFWQAWSVLLGFSKLQKDEQNTHTHTHTSLSKQISRWITVEILNWKFQKRGLVESANKTAHAI
jgi:hypothetical protein